MPASVRRAIAGFVAIATRTSAGIAVVGAVMVVVAGILTLVGPVRPASAHPIPPGFNPFAPSPVKATIDTYEPESAKDAFVLKTYGAIAHHWLQAKRGHEVIVHGYQDEPFIRIDAEGRTYDNLKSPTLYVNQDPAGGGSVPPSADAGAPPDWKVDAEAGGIVSWHDHRTHWMVADPPTTMAGSDVIQEWQLKLSVDGAPVIVKGALHRDPAISWSDYQIKVPGATPEPSSNTLPMVLSAAVGVLIVAFVVWARRSARRRATTPTASGRSGNPRARSAAQRKKVVQKR